MEKSTHQNQVIQTQRTVPYTPDEVYAAFSDPVQLAKWWGPKNFTNTFKAFEFKTDGGWKCIMHGPDGHNYLNESVFSELKAGEKIVIRHFSPPHFTLSVSLLPSDKDNKVRWVQEF